MNTFHINLSFAVFCSLLSGERAAAHDLSTYVGQDEPAQVSPELSNIITDPLEAEIAQSVIDGYKLWDAGQTLTGCFQGGDNELRKFFVDVSQIWDREASISFDFGSPNEYRNCDQSSPSVIRVSFEAGRGNWSYVGTDAIQVSAAKPTLNISVGQNFSVVNKRQLGGTILHELGHALALQHEHQSPEANCEASLDWPVVYDELGRPPNSWDREKVDRNMRPLVASRRLLTSAYDQASIMHYSFPARWFVDGETSGCYVRRANRLSPTDIAAIKVIYPATPQEQDTYLEQLDVGAASVISEMGLSPEVAKKIEELINRSLSAIEDREFRSEVSVRIGNVDVSNSDCTQIIGQAGDVTIDCSGPTK